MTPVAGPTQPVERWEGGGLEPDDQAQKHWFELVALPTLNATVLDGDRASARLERDEPAAGLCLFLLHRSPTGVVTQLNCNQPCNTSWQAASGVIHVPKMYAERHGVFGPKDGCTPRHVNHYAMLNRDFDDAKRAATLDFKPEDNMRWTDVPDLVSRYLLDTCEYIRTLG